MTLTSLIGRNLLRKKSRTFLTITAVAIAVMLYVLIRTLVIIWGANVAFSAQNRVYVRNKVSMFTGMPERYTEMIRGIPGVKAATQIYWFGGKEPRFPDYFFSAVAVDPPSFLKVWYELIVPEDQKQGWLADRQGAMVGKAMAAKLNLKIGDKVTINGAAVPGDWTFNVRAIYSTKQSTMDQSTLMFHWKFMNDLAVPPVKDSINVAVALLENKDRAGEASKAIDAFFDPKDVQTLSESEQAVMVSMVEWVGSFLTAFNGVCVIILIIILLLVTNTMSMAARERMREYATMRAVGLPNSMVVKLIVGEGILLVSIGAGLGIALSYPFVGSVVGPFLETQMGALFPHVEVESGLVGTTLGLSLLAGIVAAIAPAIRATTKPVRELLATR